MTDPAGEERVQRTTREHEEQEAQAAHVADRRPTRGEESSAEEHALDPEVVEHEEEMNRRGAEVEGEGRIE